MTSVTYLLIILGLISRCLAYDVVFAVNAGGRDFTDSLGIEYEEDTSRDGQSSNYGERFSINRVPPEDAGLYQTER